MVLGFIILGVLIIVSASAIAVAISELDEKLDKVLLNEDLLSAEYNFLATELVLKPKLEKVSSGKSSVKKESKSKTKKTVSPKKKTK